jgi:RimJ/RimL family protein N-acetyltransferase
MTSRSEYFLKLSEVLFVDTHPQEFTVQIRTVQLKDASLLAELMIDAYRGTIDYDGETFDDALSEVNAFFAGKRGGQPWLDMSFLAFSDSHLVGACLISDWQERQLPIIAYLMTSADWKNRGIGRKLLNQVLKEIDNKGFTEVRAVITNGNTPSESLFLKLGFQKAQAL